MRHKHLVDTNYTPMQLFGHLEPTKGEVGIEIEVEGKRLPKRFEMYWRGEHDGSLRGAEATEYVLKKPLPRNKYVKALANLSKRFKDSDSIIDDSGRAGVHVHINFQDIPLKNIASMAVLYFIYEEALTSFCGEDRTGNLFCLGTKYAENVLNTLHQFMQDGNMQPLNNDNIRYASLNLKALMTYGSLEFRAMRGTVDMDVIQTWVEILLNLKDAAVCYNDPKDILADFSYLGPDVFAEKIFKQHAEMLLKDYISQDDVREAMWSAQPLCYSREWGENLEINKDRGNPLGGGRRLMKRKNKAKKKEDVWEAVEGNVKFEDNRLRHVRKYKNMINEINIKPQRAQVQPDFEIELDGDAHADEEWED